MSKYLAFNLMRDTGKTKFVSVHSKSSGDRLAILHWYGPWRQYVIAPERGTVWNAGCLEDVIAYMSDLMAERKKP